MSASKQIFVEMDEKCGS